MLILLDECVPRPLKRDLTKYYVQTVVKMGWAGTKNRALLKKKTGIAVVVLVAPSNRMADLLPLMTKARETLKSISLGDVIKVV